MGKSNSRRLISGSTIMDVCIYVLIHMHMHIDRERERGGGGREGMGREKIIC